MHRQLPIIVRFPFSLDNHLPHSSVFMQETTVTGPTDKPYLMEEDSSGQGCRVRVEAGVRVSFSQLFWLESESELELVKFC